MKTAGTLTLSFAVLASLTRLAAAQTAAPAPAPAPAPIPIPAPAQGTTSTTVSATAAVPERDLLAEAVGPDRTAEREWAEREAKLNESSALTGGVGLFHMQHAQGGASGQFRVGFTTAYFSAGFLCSQQFQCRDPQDPSKFITSDSADHIGGHLTLSMQVASWLDTYLATSAIANSNPANRPTLLQVLGDSTLGAKAHGAITNVFHVGGAFELWLVNGTGSVGLDGGGTSAKFRGLATVDLRQAEKRLPVRMTTNLTYVLDNSGEVVVRTETARGAPITRIERFGLNINRVDHFDVGLGVEFFASEDKVRPFIEYNVLVPMNRQNYRCRPNNPSGDKCLANDAFAPSSLTIGSRFYPWRKGFSLVAALDVGVSGTGFFIEEMRPTPPWTLYFGAGWAIDTQDKPALREHLADRPGLRGGRKIRGFVHEEGQQAGIASAIVAWENHPELTSLATGTDGRFTTHDLAAGTYGFTLHAEGFKPGHCSTTIGAEAAPGAPPAAPPQAPQQGESGEVQLDCVMQALPRVGSVTGKVKDLDTGKFIAGAAIKVVDVAKKELSGSTDGDGAFRFELVTPGEAQVTVDADTYLVSSEKLDVKVQKDNPIEITLKKKPKNASVALKEKEIVIRQQVQFGVDSANILVGSNGLLAEIADLMLRNPRVKKVEVQGHTDGTGDAPHNQKLSEDRAAAVVAWLVQHGISSDRLVAKGYGDSRPIVPNVTDLNRARNRRVQFIILEQDLPPTTLGTPALGAPSLGSGAVPKP